MIKIFSRNYNKEETDILYEMLGVTKKTIKKKIKEDKNFATLIELLKLNKKIEKLEEGTENGHTLRVATLAKKMAEAAHLSEDEVKSIYLAALYHDIGKYKISAKIISKPGPLTKEEYEIVKTHVDLATEMLDGLLPNDTIEIIKCHHERMDKSGYPRGIEPSSIGAKIIAIVDSYDAMTSKRVYNSSKSKDIAFQELKMCTVPRDKGGIGYLYDPYFVDILIDIESK